MGARCDCDYSKFSGRRCESGEACATRGNSACDPNGTKHCEEVGDGVNFLCVCEDRYSGTYCSEFFDACDSTPCRNGAACSPTGEKGAGQGYECSCATGWSGVDCGQDIDECSSNPCEQMSLGAQCLNGIGE